MLQGVQQGAKHTTLEGTCVKELEVTGVTDQPSFGKSGTQAHSHAMLNNNRLMACYIQDEY